MIKILGIWTDWGDNEYRKLTGEYGGLGYYRIAKPLLALQEAYPNEFQVRIIGPEFATEFGENFEQIMTNIFTEYDIVFCKQIDNAAASSALLAAAEYFGKKVIIDIDDNHFAAREDTAAGEVYGVGKIRRYTVAAELSLCNALAVSTDPLEMTYRAALNPNGQKFQENIFVLPNCNDVGDWLMKRTDRQDGKIRIGYMGSITHNHDLALVIPALRAILQKYPHVELELLGLMQKKDFKSIKKQLRSVKGRVSLHLGTPSWKGYPDLVAKMGWDIGIAPLTEDGFNACKSHIKWMEYAMVNTVVVASKVYPYFMDIQGKKTIEHGKTGMLAATTEEWVDCLSQLIENEPLRAEISKNAYEYIKSEWQWKDHIHKWAEMFRVCNSAIPQTKTE